MPTCGNLPTYLIVVVLSIVQNSNTVNTVVAKITYSLLDY